MGKKTCNQSNETKTDALRPMRISSNARVNVKNTIGLASNKIAMCKDGSAIRDIEQNNTGQCKLQVDSILSLEHNHEASFLPPQKSGCLPPQMDVMMMITMMQMMSECLPRQKSGCLPPRKSGWLLSIKHRIILQTQLHAKGITSNTTTAE